MEISLIRGSLVSNAETNFERYIYFKSFAREPKKICDANPKELILKFIWKRWKNIRAVVREEFMPEHIHLFTGKWCRALVEGPVSMKHFAREYETLRAL